MGSESTCSTSYGERMRQNLLLCTTRGVCQFGRLSWAPLVIYISRDLNLTTLERGQLLSAFPLGYLLTQLLGGMAADKFGGKPVQTMTLVVFAVGMLLGPSVASLRGACGLYWIYFLIGVFAGPQHPATAAMTSAWFPQDELGFANSMQDIGLIAGELLATLFAPVLASIIGWGPAFLSIGFVSAVYCLVWQLFAKSRPVAPVERPSSTMSDQDAGNPAATPASAFPPAEALLYTQVWAVIFQHMCFNGSKYFFTSWMATYYDKVFHMGPAQSAAYVSAEKFVGIAIPVIWRPLEKYLLGSDGSSLRMLRSRKTFAALGFGISALASLSMMRLTVVAGQYTLAPLLVAIILCINQAGLAAHSFGFKTNYLDLTSRYSGAFMGVGNMFATAMTYVVPLGAAYLMELTGGDWSLLFMGLMLLNSVGAVIGFRFTSVIRLDDELEELAKRKRDAPGAKGLAHTKAE